MAEDRKHEHAVISLAGKCCPSPARGAAGEEAATDSVPLQGQAMIRTAPSVDTATAWSLTLCHSRTPQLGGDAAANEGKGGGSSCYDGT
jgi:hypothetical protein